MRAHEQAPTDESEQGEPVGGEGQAAAGGRQVGPTPAGAGQSNNTRGIIAMLVAMASFACGDSLMKLASVAIPTGELIFLRSSVIASVSALTALLTGAFQHSWRLLSPAMAIRALSDVSGSMAFQSALARMAFADLVAIIQLNPLMVTAASAVFLSERVGWRRWAATAVGLAGVLLIIRPGTSAFTWWSLVAILSVICSTTRDVSTKVIDRAVPGTLIMMFSSAVVVLGGAALSLVETWTFPAPFVLLLVIGAGVFSLVGQLAVIIAVRTGDLSAVAPFRYSILLWALVLGFVLWGYLPDLPTLGGMAIVAGAGLYSFRREFTGRRRR